MAVFAGGVFSPCIDFLKGWEGVGGVWEIPVTASLFFPTVPSLKRSKPGQETAVKHRANV